MSFKSIRSEPFKTTECRFSYVKDMFFRVPKKDNKTKQPILDKNGQQVTEQRVTLIFDRAVTQMAIFQDPIVKVITEQWGDTAIKRFKEGLIRSPILAGDGKEAKNRKTGEINPGLGADKFFVRCTTRLEAPVLYKSKMIPATHGDGPDQVKSGDYGFAVLSAYTWYNEESGDGVSFGIHYLQKLRDGESLGGTGSTVNVEDYFEAVSSSPAMGAQSADALFG